MAKGRWWLTTDSVDLEIGCNADRLYDMVADMPRMGEWSPECEAVEWTGDTTGPEVGATFVGHNRTGPFNKIKWSRHGHVLTADPGREFAFVTEEGHRDSTVWRYRFEPIDGGTRVTESYEIRWLPAWARIADGPLNRKRDLIKGMNHTLGQLKAKAEADATDGATRH